MADLWVGPLVRWMVDRKAEQTVEHSAGLKVGQWADGKAVLKVDQMVGP